MTRTVPPLFKKAPEPAHSFGPPAAERFFKIRSTKTGLYKLAGLKGANGETKDKRGHVPGWSKIGKTWTVKSLAGHFALFLRYNQRKSVWTGKGYEPGSLTHPDMEEGAPYYAIPEEYEVVEYFALGTVIPLKNALGKKIAAGASIVLQKEKAK